MPKGKSRNRAPAKKESQQQSKSPKKAYTIVKKKSHRKSLGQCGKPVEQILHEQRILRIKGPQSIEQISIVKLITYINSKGVKNIDVGTFMVLLATLCFATGGMSIFGITTPHLPWLGGPAAYLTGLESPKPPDEAFINLPKWLAEKKEFITAMELMPRTEEEARRHGIITTETEQDQATEPIIQQGQEGHPQLVNTLEEIVQEAVCSDVSVEEAQEIIQIVHEIVDSVEEPDAGASPKTPKRTRRTKKRKGKRRRTKKRKGKRRRKTKRKSRIR